jgi:hypothetical protein
LDGVFVPDNGAAVFHPLANLDTSDLADLLQVIRVRVLSFLERQSVIESRHELTLLDDAEEWLKNHDGFAEREPALAQLTSAAVSGLLDLDPLSLLFRLAASVPPPGFHLVHYAGVLASASKLRALVVPPAPPEFTAHAKHSHREQPPPHRSRYRPWAELPKRTFQIDVERCECGGRFKLRALVIEAHNIERLLRYLGEPLEPPKRAPATRVCSFSSVLRIFVAKSPAAHVPIRSPRERASPRTVVMY